jgi:hypothetical protein
MAGAPDRYEPLPGLLQLPAFLYRKLGPRGRRGAQAAAAALLIGLAAGIAFGLPAVDRARRERAAAEDRALAQARAATEARQRAEMRPRVGRGHAAAGLAGAAALTARHALTGDLAAAVERDARARVAAGELKFPIHGAQCERFPRLPDGADPAGDAGVPEGRYQCLAVTATFTAGETTEGGAIGYPYRALVDFRTGRFAYCKVSGRPGEGSLTRRLSVTVPRACGGG